MFVKTVQTILMLIMMNDELFFQNGWLTKDAYVLFPAGTIVRDSHHHKAGFKSVQIVSSDFAE